MKKTIKLLLIVLLAVPCVCLAACKEGTAGTPGKSAYQIWQEAGNTGTEADFLNSLKGAAGKDAVFSAASTEVGSAQQLRDALLSRKPYIVIKNDINDFDEEWGIEGDTTDKTIVGQGHTVNAAFHVSKGAKLKVFDLNIQPAFTAEADNPNKAGIVVAEDASVEFYNVRVEMPAALAATYGIYIADTAREAYLEGVRVFNRNTSGYAIWTSSEDVKFFGGEYGSQSTYTAGFGNTLTVQEIKDMFIVVPVFAAKAAGQFDLLVLNLYEAGQTHHKLNIADLMKEEDAGQNRILKKTTGK